MLIPKLRIDVYQNLGENRWSTTPIIFQGAFTFDETEGIEVRKDTFSFKFQNSRRFRANDYDNQMSLGVESTNAFRINDKLKIYAYYSQNPPTVLSNALLIDGIVTEYKEDSDEGGNLITIDGANATEVMLSTMTPAAYIDTGSQTVSDCIVDIINKMNKFNPQLKLACWKETEKRRWDAGTNTFIVDNTNGAYGSVQSTKKSGSSFPYIGFAENWKSSYEQIETLSGAEYTQDDSAGVYVFGINSFTDPVCGSVFNQLFWNNKTTSLSGSIVQGTDTSNSKVSRGTWEVVNAIITNAGQDLYGAGILKLAINPTSMGKNGAKWKYYPLTNKFDRVYDSEKTYGSSLGSTFGTDRFPDTYTWVHRFVTRDSLTGSKGNTVATSASDSAFNENLRQEAGWQAYFEAKSIVDQFGNPRFKAEFDLDVGSNNYRLGDLYELVVPSFGWENQTGSPNPTKKLRLTNAKHTFNNQGWNTSLQFDEDEKTVSDQVNG